MLGIVVEILLSWLLLKWLLGENLKALGLQDIRKRLGQFGLGFGITALLCLLAQFLEAHFKNGHWVLNPNFGLASFFAFFKWDFISVLSEELLFRGALLYILIQKLGPKAAISISALSFGVYHWFSYGVLGNFMPMLVVLISTGLMGWAWALAFVKTRSIFMPIGFHFGWNLMYNTGFSKGPLGDGLLILEEAQPITETLSTLNFLVGALIIPLIVLLSVAFGLKKSAPIDRPSEKVEIF